MENLTFRYHTLSIEGLKLAPQSSYPVFILLLMMYVLIMVSNVAIVILILFEKSLHSPMHIIFCNLPLNDTIGPTVVVPTLLRYIFKEPSDHYISYLECITQAYVCHFFSTTSHTILMIMAYDRYVAICNPLRYATIMTNKMVIKLTASAWGVPVVLVGILIGLTARLSHCTSTIFNPYCDNAALFKLSCEDTSINNIYGLFFTAVLLSSSIGTILITYIRIATMCVTSKNKQLNTKALKTCSTHMAVYAILLVSGLSIIVLHRLPNLSENRKMASILFYVVPPFLNPIIYGVQTKEIRNKIVKLFRGNKGVKSLSCSTSVSPMEDSTASFSVHAWPVPTAEPVLLVSVADPAPLGCITGPFLNPTPSLKLTLTGFLSLLPLLVVLPVF
ncbi:olfactory receptor 13H1-like [Colossoma macropomum]|uniref:olfactory receptor 13H1-like n=1 Tax=Colossoma macropomum TaxID=42526 RepID=UPI0018651E2C|nr:olfactory receptor 13H1-like [Colossoma macropomum]